MGHWSWIVSFWYPITLWSKLDKTIFMILSPIICEDSWSTLSVCPGWCDRIHTQYLAGSTAYLLYARIGRIHVVAKHALQIRPWSGGGHIGCCWCRLYHPEKGNKLVKSDCPNKYSLKYIENWINNRTQNRISNDT